MGIKFGQSVTPNLLIANDVQYFMHIISFESALLHNLLALSAKLS
jgi:hypothetical protein